MNQMSAVLAADSASTLSYHDEEGHHVRKYFKGAHKIFQISENHPVGLMIHGNAEILGVPWELVIKEFRKHLKNRSFDSIEGYAKHFQKYLVENQQFFPDQAREESFFHMIAFETIHACQYLDSEIEENSGLNETVAFSSLAKKIDALEFSNNQDDKFLKHLIEKWPYAILAQLRSEYFSDYHSYLGERTDDQLFKIIHVVITRDAKQFNNPTGLVFAGFGNSSIFPEMYAVEDVGFIAGKLIMANARSRKITREKNSYLSGFAQSSMTDAFIVGFDRDAYTDINRKRRQELPVVLEPFLKKLGGTIERDGENALLKNAEGKVLVDEENFAAMLDEALSPVEGKIFAESREKHWTPLARVISMLPAEEMAELAETMVDLQSLKERMTQPTETVGGPVDVAIITKNEGLVWKKRKHFFDASINQRYLNRIKSQG